jgi:hypothetical protein
VPHTGASRLPVVAVIVVGHGCGPWKALLVPLFATMDALPAAVDGDIRRHSLAATRGHLPASLGRPKHDHLIAGAFWVVMLCDASNVFLQK